MILCGVLSEMCVSATRAARSPAASRSCCRDGHATYDLDDIPAAVVRRVAEHALGDEPDFPVSTTDVTFATPD